MKILVLGNGFDLDLGLKTRYSDFAISSEWEELYARFMCTSKDNLARFLKEKANEGHWFAIEACLAEYAEKKIKEDDFEHVSEDEWFFELLKEQLDTYLTLVSMESQEENHLATHLLHIMSERQIFDRIYTFNYIPHDALHHYLGCNYENDIYYVHQQLGLGIVLGVAEKDITDDRYSFLRKVNHASYPSTSLCNDLMEADEVVIFGHSLNTIDFDYFRDFFKACSQYNPSKMPWITIISKDKQSIQTIKNNLKFNGISVTSLNQYSHLSFIALDNYYRKDRVDSDSVYNLKKRLNIDAL